MPYLSGITIYPVKSLDGLGLTEATVLPNGALMHDRRWRLVDDEGAVVNAKKNARFHAIRSSFQIEGIDGSDVLQDGVNKVILSLDEGISGDFSSLGQEIFPLVPGRDGPCEWLSEALATNVFLQERFEGGFPDDRDSPGPTLVSYESLNEVASWFDWTVAEVRRRFRMNLEVAVEQDAVASKDSSGAPGTILHGAFWEDALACPVTSSNGTKAPAEDFFEPEYPADEPRGFKIGGVLFWAAGVCRRCSVPERNSLTGAPNYLFRDQFEAFRAHRLPASVHAGKWPDFYHLGINTTCKTDQGSLEIGQAFQLIERN